MKDKNREKGCRKENKDNGWREERKKEHKAEGRGTRRRLWKRKPG